MFVSRALPPPTRKGLREKLCPKLTEEEVRELEIGNLWMTYRVAVVVCVIEAVILVSALLFYRNSLSEQLPGLMSVTICLCICLGAVLLTRKWQQTGSVASSNIQIFTEVLYWTLSLWGMAGSYRHYVLGEQMLIFDSVQVCFALMLSCHPLRALLHFVGAYGGFYSVLLRFDGAAQIQGLNYFGMGALLFSANLLRFRRELLFIRLQASQRDQIQNLESASCHDGLTGLRNRYALRQDFPGYVGKKIWVVMADIDRFKQYNDTYGHGVGDRLLSAIGESIRAEFGAQSCYRYGGDEFLFFVEEENESAVQERLSRWEHTVSQITVETAVERVKPRCSYGMAGGFVGSELELRTCMRRADERLYEAKALR